MRGEGGLGGVKKVFTSCEMLGRLMTILGLPPGPCGPPGGPLPGGPRRCSPSLDPRPPSLGPPPPRLAVRITKPGVKSILGPACGFPIWLGLSFTISIAGRLFGLVRERGSRWGEGG